MSFTNSLAFYTLGCKLNYAETSSIANKMAENGFTVKEFNQPADAYIINTCSVTDHADTKCKKLVKDALATNPNAKIVIMGCYAQLKPQEIAQIPGVNMVLGASEKFNLSNHIHKLFNQSETLVYHSPIMDIHEFSPSYSFGERTRAFLKVQDGCNYFCAFCTIPLARGRSRSATIHQVVKQADEIAQKGIKEIVLTGVNIGDFSNDENQNFLQLIKELDKVEGIERFRISSIEPNLLSNDIIEFVAQSQKFVPHFHIPLQSGSNRILKLMRRRYHNELYIERVNQIKTLMPNACIGVDVIVGFPSETEEDFKETYTFIKNLEVSYLHVFTYSERTNTTALRIKPTIPHRIRKERNTLLTQLSNQKKYEFYSSQVNKQAKVLWEHENKEGSMFGFTENYIRCKTDFDIQKVNTMENINMIELLPDTTMLIKEN